MPRRKLSDKEKALRAHSNVTNLYDSVAGRITNEGFVPTHQVPDKYRDNFQHTTQPIPPEKALFRLKGRDFEGEDDPYWADRHLTSDQRLPDSDLLKAIHVYASDFYSRNLGKAAAVDYKSMDETALLSCGILMEEMADAVLGETGELALTEGEVPVAKFRNRGTKDMIRDGTKYNDDAALAPVNSEEEGTVQKERVSPVRRDAKKRKIIHHKSDGD